LNPRKAPRNATRRSRDQLLDTRRSVWTPLFLCLLVVCLTVLADAGSEGLRQSATTALVNLVAVVGLYIFVGNSGVLSFGHMSFMAIGAYASALLTIPKQQKSFLLPSLPHFLETAHLSTVQAAVVGGLVAAAFALVVAVPLMRLTGLAAGIGTFAVLVIVYVVASNWNAVTRGEETMIGVPLDTTLNAAVIWACLAIISAFLFQESRFGLRLRATREDEPAARAIGIGVFWERTAAFALSAFWMGIAGALYGHLLGSFSPNAFYLTLTFLTFVMLVIGGISSLSGAVIGTIIISVISEVMFRVEEGMTFVGVHLKAPSGVQQIVLALFLLSVLILRPEGITGGKEITLPRRRSRSRSDD
jgi:branched-chain amino acid transport system permease protein